MPAETMTPRERWLAVLRRETPDRVPMGYRGTAEITARLLEHLACGDTDELFRRLHIDKVYGVSPEYIGPRLSEDTDMYGCRYRNVSYGTGVYRECLSHPLAGCETVADIQSNYTWPTADWFDYTGLRGQVAGREEYPVNGGGSEPFLIYKHLRGDEQAFMDLILHPDIVHHCLDRLFEFCYQDSRRIYEQIPDHIMFSYVAEDMGGQQNLLFSPEQIHEFFFPRMKRMIDLAHQAGAFVFCHSDGAVRNIIADLLDIGIDALDPIQWRARNMEREALKRDFGARLVFHGGVDNQQTLAFGTEQDVREEVIYNLRVLGRNGGYILAPCHNIQAVSPPENVVAMYETGYEYGWTA